MSKKKLKVVYVLKDGHSLPAGTLGIADTKGKVFTFTNGSINLTVNERHILTFAEPQTTKG